MQEVSHQPKIKEKEFPINVSKYDLARALKMSNSTLQEMLNRKYLDKLLELGYQVEAKTVNRKVLNFLKIELALLPEDFLDLR